MGRASSPWYAAVCAALLTVSSSARADDARRSARLRYDISRSTAMCPDETSFRNLVAARLGYDPFSADADDLVAVELVGEGASLRGRVQLQRARSDAGGARELSGDPAECANLVAAFATSVALALDPIHALHPVAAAPIAPPAPPPPPARPPDVPAPASPDTLGTVAQEDRPPATRLYASAGAVTSIAIAPSVTVGGAIAVGLSYRALSAEIEGRAESTPAAGRDAMGDRLEATLYTVGVVPCGAVGDFRGCIFARVGDYQGLAPDLPSPNLPNSVFASVGVRAGYTLGLSKIFALRAELEGAVPLVRTSLYIDNTPVWRAPPVTGGLDLALVVRPM